MSKSITSINLYNLEAEWVRQADLVKEWGDKLTDAEGDLDDLNVELELTEAEVAYAIRQRPEEFAVQKSKLSETMIKKIIPLQPEWQTVQAAVNKQKRVVGYLKTTMKALEHKKAALEKLVARQLAGFFSDPRVARPPSDRLNVTGIDKPKKGAK